MPFTDSPKAFNTEGTESPSTEVTEHLRELCVGFVSVRSVLNP
jgi:hypothetical protein